MTHRRALAYFAVASLVSANLAAVSPSLPTVEDPWQDDLTLLREAFEPFDLFEASA